jgi:hypothetical protein
MVKSRRRTSSSALAVYRTPSGWRPSEYAPSERNVATSVTTCGGANFASTTSLRELSELPDSASMAPPASPPVATSTTPKRAPTAKVRGNICSTTSGVAAGCHVVVLGLAAQQQIAHAAARKIRLIAGGAQLGHDPQGRIELARGGQHGNSIVTRAAVRWETLTQPLNWIDELARPYSRH